MAKNAKRKIIIVNIAIIFFLLVFFVKICPIVPYDQDDWIYLGKIRIPFPIWKEWNPSKVLPEVLMPLCGYLGAYLFYPIFGDYIFSISFAAAIIIVVFIMGMCYCVMQFFYRRMHMSVELALIFEVLFLILCFLIFRNRGTSRFMFSAENMNCIFNYTIPGITNAICVLLLMQYQNFQREYQSFSIVKKGLFVVLVYFAVFSNLFHSGMLAIYCGTIVLKGMGEYIQEEKKNVKNFYKHYSIYFMILVLWILAVIFELSGGRADTVSYRMNLSIMIPVKQLMVLVGALSKPFILMSACAFIWLLVMLVCKKEDRGVYYLVLLNSILVISYLIILCSAINYMSRIEASWSIWFYIILVTLLGIANFVQTFPKTKSFLILGLILLSILAFYPDGRFLISTVGNIDYDTCAETDRYIVGQIVKASSGQQPKGQIHVPLIEDEKLKWTFTDSYAESMAVTLYNHGIISEKIKVITYADPEFVQEMRKWNEQMKEMGISKQ